MGKKNSDVSEFFLLVQEPGHKMTRLTMLDTENRSADVDRTLIFKPKYR